MIAKQVHLLLCARPDPAYHNLDWYKKQLLGFISSSQLNTMSWFGFGGGDSKKPDQDRAAEVPVRIDDFDDTSFASGPSSSPSLGHDLGGGSGNFQEQLAVAQQQMIFQQVMIKLTDLSFERCVTKPGTSLSYSEQTCIQATVGKFVDCSQLILQRVQNSQGGK